ncbi:FtsQ-type POTRA domain-containing protein [Microbacterium sp. TNHR37B]|uniref:FtsQ-type POTRA domain-containing protein n=1 Tax=Microbacterium sp. TNHR37B TaxID=1775956 RepID=UPI0007B1C32B|nr:FtsQ-type POTRA domain-containing protein [Microbacterium sp. TNHR37B]KZE90683.1 Cell division protein FtsQ [Microbacterium sp. TNHR37B]
MRRPTPLPPPERESRPRDPDVDLDLDVRDLTPPTTAPSHAPAPATDESGAIAAEDELAEIVLFAPPGEEREPAADAPLGVRDVWTAARARRRALRAEVRRFTARQRHRRMAWIVSVSAVLLLVVLSIGAAYSPLFAVERVKVVGAAQLDAGAVERALANQIGRPLALVDSGEVKAALVAFPLVETYTLEARPPHELVVRIVERLPIGSIKSAAGYTLVDAAGVALSTTADRPKDYPTISVPGGVTSAAFEAVGTVFRSLPDDVRSQVTALKATTPNDVTLTLGATDTDVVWGNASESALKAVTLERIMIERPPSEVSLYDVSSPRAVVVR